MTTPADCQKVSELLCDIQQLYQSGEFKQALAQINSYLNEFPHDRDAAFLKADICLELGEEVDFVGMVLAEYAAQPHARMAQLQARVEQRVQKSLASGRARLRDRSANWCDAVTHFERAVTLSPADPSVPLAAALALMNQRSRSDDDSRERRGLPFDMTPSLRRSPEPGDDVPAACNEYVERFLQLALERGTPEHRSHDEAARHLVRHWLRNDRVDAALDLLGSLSGALQTELQDEVARRTLRDVLNVARTLLVAHMHTETQQLLECCAVVAPEMPRLRLMHAEVLAQTDQPAAALDAYRALLDAPGDDWAVQDAAAVQQAWELADTFQVTCTRCGKLASARNTRCQICDMALDSGDLLADRYDLRSESDATHAHLGAAEMLIRLERRSEAPPHINSVLDTLSRRDPARRRLEDLRTECSLPDVPTPIGEPPQPSRPLSALIETFRAEGLVPRVVAELRYLCQGETATWHLVPLQTRLALLRRLVAGAYLDLAQLFAHIAFVDNPARLSVQRALARMENAVATFLAATTAQAQDALEAGHYEQSIDHADTALRLRPDHTAALLVRGQARLASGHDLQALNDFHAVLHREDVPAASTGVARIGAARALERRWRFDNALALLEGVTGADADTIRARLDRRLSNEPALRLRHDAQAVMHDTLLRTDAAQVHGYFAVAVRAVGRPWGQVAHNAWTEAVLHAGFEFVQVLGGLRNVPGYPVFALRLISEPHPAIPERGQLHMALVARVSAASPAETEALALDLWYTLRGILPAVQHHVYTFEAVADEAELNTLLQPFEANTLAEIVRREDIPQHDDDNYAVYPFAPGALALHDLCWALLRNPVPAMLSVHLLPTNLLAWERAAMDEMMLDERETLTGRIGEIDPRNPISAWWQNAPRLGQAQANRQLVDTLSSQAYVMRVNVAGSQGSSPLLPERVAAALFGPVRPVHNALFGGYEVVRVATDVEARVAARNLSDVDVEGWVYSAAPDGAHRLRHLFSEHEAALAFRFPVPGGAGLPGVPLIDARPVAPPAALPERGTVLGVSVARVGGIPQPIIQSGDDRRRHCYIVGKTGVGKSTLIGAMALQDIEAGAGVCVVDPHGDLVEDILARIPEHRASDVILFDPSDAERPIGLNLLEARSESEKHRIVTEFIGLLVRMYDPGQIGIVGPRFQHNVRNAMLTAMALESGTLIEVVRVLSDSGFVKSILPRVTDPIVRTYWEKQVANTSDFHKSEILDYIVSKFSRFVGDQLVRNIVGQRHTTVDFREVMDRKRILLVNLSKGRIGPESAQFLGLLLVQRLLLTALSRADVPAAQRPDFFLYVDEFQNFATEMFQTVLSEGRKYGVAVTVANQYLTQLDGATREAIFGNVGSIISFRLGTQDAAVLTPEMYPVFGADDLINLPKYTACVKLLVDGVAARPFTMRTLPDTRPPDYDRANTIRELSRGVYGRAREEIEQDVLDRFLMKR